MRNPLNSPNLNEKSRSREKKSKKNLLQLSKRGHSSVFLVIYKRAKTKKERYRHQHLKYTSTEIWCAGWHLASREQVAAIRNEYENFKVFFTFEELNMLILDSKLNALLSETGLKALEKSLPSQSGVFSHSKDLQTVLKVNHYAAPTIFQLRPS